MLLPSVENITSLISLSRSPVTLCGLKFNSTWHQDRQQCRYRISWSAFFGWNSILLIFAENDRLRNPENVNAIICAELPPKPSAFGCKKKNVQAGRLHATVLKCMIHGPCSLRNPRSPCMVDGKCSKGYPKTFCKQTSWTQWSSYPSYRRRSTDDGGSTAIVGDFVVDNSWVVPYSPFLSLKFDAHINVEACVSPFAAKYLFLYINKVFWTAIAVFCCSTDCYCTWY